MAQVELIMPKMGESIMEATILKWLKKEGDTVELDETILEIATDKVDSEIPSPVEGKIVKILHQEDEVVEIGKAIALIETDAAADVAASPSIQEPVHQVEEKPAPKNGQKTDLSQETRVPEPPPAPMTAVSSDRFYSPLVKNMAKAENIALNELDQISGSGLDGRVTKTDMLSYIQNRSSAKSTEQRQETKTVETNKAAAEQGSTKEAPVTQSVNGNVEIIEMDRMRKLISEHMVKSKHTSPHVTSFVEVDVTNMVQWRNKIKKSFQDKHGQKITFTPLFVEAVARAITDFPMINISVEGDKILRKKAINIGMAAALPSGNLIVPVIRNAETLNLLGLTKQVNDLATRARENKLKADEIQGGTFTITNVGTFGNVMGTPIINQPQVAILATGAIQKKPAVLETPEGDVIAIRHMMFLSLSYDHRVVDGALGGSFLRKVADYMEAFDGSREL